VGGGGGVDNTEPIIVGGTPGDIFICARVFNS
jgi:hypothetical protein